MMTLVKVTSDILDYLDKNKVCFLKPLDLSITIDTTNLVQRLEEIFGLSETVLKCLSPIYVIDFSPLKLVITRQITAPQSSDLGLMFFTGKLKSSKVQENFSNFLKGKLTDMV